MAEFDPAKFFSGQHGTAPPSAALLNFEFQEADVERGWIRIKFTPRQEFLNPAGVIQGGFLVAMLDDTMGPAVIVKSGGTKMTTSIDIHTHFMRPVKLAPVYCEAEVTRLGRSIAYIEGKLFDEAGRLCVRATSSAMIMSFPTSE
ncbi:PaaI family thioesterase [Ponticaulis profundi]|uniref:PaaI family thioesterase n=1 Tax=Ponticaulis profundi TaxID=2665222 RepID=A0ABW1SBQ9_9PROT